MALMEIQASRAARARRARAASRSCCSTRTARAGTSCSSAAAWRRSARAEALGGARGPYALQAAIAACHARARTADETDWARIAALYDALAAGRRRRRSSSSTARWRWRWPSGPRPGWSSSTRWSPSRRSQSYHLLPSVRGDLLVKLGRLDEARAEFERAAALTRNARERDLLLERAAACARTTAPV